MSVMDTAPWIARIRERDDLPDDIKELMVKVIIKNRMALEHTLGTIELIHLRHKQGPITFIVEEAPQ